jgi:4-hydroxysphinganine ceramide fatty acyl 2-hydroxylase
MPKATPESPKMFESDWIDAFSRTHFSVVPLLFAPAIGALLWSSVVREGLPWLQALGLVGVGVFAWTLSEYWLHRTVFHWLPPGRLGERFHFLIHGVHHKWPNDRYRLVMPPAVSFGLFLLLLGLWSLVFGTRYGFAFHAGFTLGYVFYDLMHFYLHHGRPKGRYLKELRRHHLVHHFKTPERRYGVSSKFWDYVFATERD